MRSLAFEAPRDYFTFFVQPDGEPALPKKPVFASSFCVAEGFDLNPAWKMGFSFARRNLAAESD
jgi:hypothetical protein